MGLLNLFHTAQYVAHDCNATHNVAREVARDLRSVVSDLHSAKTCEIQYRFTRLLVVAEDAAQRLEALLR